MFSLCFPISLVGSDLGICLDSFDLRSMCGEDQKFFTGLFSLHIKAKQNSLRSQRHTLFDLVYCLYLWNGRLVKVAPFRKK